MSETPNLKTTLPRIERVQRNGRMCWLKRQERPAGRMRLQKGDPKAAFVSEKALLTENPSKCLPLPELIEVGDDYFITADAGPTLRMLYRDPKTPKAEFQSALIAASRGLAELHSHGIAHGRPALKDICWDGTRVTFIDWERYRPARNTPKNFATDVVLFFFSAVVEAETGGAGLDLNDARAAYRKSSKTNVWARANIRVRRLRWLAWLMSPLFKRLDSKPEFRAVAPFFKFFMEADEKPND